MVKLEKYKNYYWKEVKSFRKESVLIVLPEVRGRGSYTPLFISFKYPLRSLANSHFCSKKFQIFFKNLKICIPMGENI
jgi:hypothetical protein